MKLSTEKLPEYFTIASPQNSHYTEYVNCFDFVDRNSNELLVTLGESWTWGSELEKRLDEVFGNLISRKKRWDWLNLAVPGSNNFFIAERFEELTNIAAQLHYERIIAICTFTEVGRGFNSHHDLHLDYVGWLKNNVHFADDFYRFLEMINLDCVNRIASSAPDNLQVFFASNFVDHLGFSNVKVIPLPWYRILGIDSDRPIYAGTTGTQRLEQLSEFLQPGHQDFFKIWFSEMIENSQIADMICRAAGGGKFSHHPGPSGHQAWAKYLLQCIDI